MSSVPVPKNKINKKKLWEGEIKLIIEKYLNPNPPNLLYFLPPDIYPYSER
jgi:hypothetical protein